MAKFEVLFKFADVIKEIEADSLKEAKEIAENQTAPIEDTYCYGVDVEEMKD